jgi:hypothetical protein
VAAPAKFPASRRCREAGRGARAARRRGELNSGATGRSGSPWWLLYGGRPEGIGAEGVADGRWRLVVGAGRRPGDARGGADVAGGGPVWAGAAEALGGSGAAPVALFGVSARRQGGWLGTLRWRRRPWRNCSGAQGAAVGLGRRRLISRARRAEERGGTKRVERRGEVSGVELTADKGGRGRGWSAAHVEAVLHGRRVEVGGRWRGRAWRAQ